MANFAFQALFLVAQKGLFRGFYGFLVNHILLMTDL